MPDRRKASLAVEVHNHAQRRDGRWIKIWYDPRLPMKRKIAQLRRLDHGDDSDGTLRVYVTGWRGCEASRGGIVVAVEVMNDGERQCGPSHAGGPVFRGVPA